MKKRLIKYIALMLLLCIPCMNACSDSTVPADGSADEESADDSIVHAEITMENGGVIKLELYHDIAPITVDNFVKLANEGFYDGLIFHRVISGFMIQGGDPNGDGTGGSEENIKGEFTNNGVQNDISHVRGVISMARQGHPYYDNLYYDTASSQFFIVHADSTYLDGNYAAFGRVTEGMDVVDEIAAVETDTNNKPLVEQKIKSIKITN